MYELYNIYARAFLPTTKVNITRRSPLFCVLWINKYCVSSVYFSRQFHSPKYLLISVRFLPFVPIYCSDNIHTYYIESILLYEILLKTIFFGHLSLPLSLIIMKIFGMMFCLWFPLPCWLCSFISTNYVLFGFS